MSVDAGPLGFVEDETAFEPYTLYITGYFAEGGTISTNVLVEGLNRPIAVPVPVNSPLMMLMMVLVLLGGAAWTFRRLS